MPMMDQVVWANVNLIVNGEPGSFTRGSLLPDSDVPEEQAQRAVLRLGGALRVVEVVYTADELAAMAAQRAETTAARAVQHDVDPAAPAGDQMPGTAPAGPPTLEAGGAPVVIGPEPAAKAKAAPRAPAASKAG